MTTGTGKQANRRYHVIIVGGGFAGLTCARKLASNPAVEITLFDKNNYLQFQPLLYQVATGLLAPSNAAFSLRNILQHDSNIDVQMAEVVSADLNTRTIKTADGRTYGGDFLVLAAGSQVSFFGTQGAREYAFPLYSLQDAESLRAHILALLESTARDPALVQRGALTFVVVGAGPTGTETAGTLAGIPRALKKMYRNINLSRLEVYLVDMGRSVLSTFSPQAQSYAAKTLAHRGVKLRLGVAVKEVYPDHALLSDGTTIRTQTIIWAGGLTASVLASSLGITSGHGGRIDVRPDFGINGCGGAYALGDFANIAGPSGKPLPQLASVAQQAGKYCAAHISAVIAGENVKPFRYVDRGIMATIGRNAAVAELGARRHVLTGTLAFATWLGVHAALLDTARARLEAVIEWAGDYFGDTRADPVLDRPTGIKVDWNSGREDEQRGAAR